MKKIKEIIYDARPDDVTIYPTCVDVIKSCEMVEIEDESTGNIYQKYRCDMERYTVPEYIDIMHKKNVELDGQLTQVQAGTVEVYEMLLSMT